MMNGNTPPAMQWHEHHLYRDGDADAPEEIKDRNGAVALQQCAVCGAGEAELTRSCIDPRVLRPLGNGSAVAVSAEGMALVLRDLKNMCKSVEQVVGAGVVDTEVADTFQDMRRINIKPGDRFVLNVPGRPSANVIEVLQARWKQFAGDAPLLILTDGTMLTLLHENEEPKHGA